MSAVKTEASADGGSVVNGAGPVYENKEDNDNVSQRTWDFAILTAHYDCILTTSSSSIIKIVDDTVVLSLIFDNTDNAYLEEIKILVKKLVPEPDDLSELLAAGTKEVHEQAENTQFVKDFLLGRIRKELFKLGAVALYYTYTAMEEEIERNKDHPQFAPLYFPNELHRHEALAQDLKYFYGEDWQDQISCSPATQRYVERLHEVGREDPALLVAHAYTRYMGDLSGGQVLKKVAQRALKLPPTGEGVFFYQFDSIHSNKGFKQLYRSRMNELELDTSTKDRIVQEAVRAFQFNMEVFQELEEMGKTIQEEVLDGGPIHGHMQGDISKCPYYAAKMAASGGSAYVYGMAAAVLRNPTAQVILAAWIAALAGLVAWYHI